MSRSSSGWRAFVLGTTLIAAMLPASASAADDRPQHIWVPEPFAEAVDFPVVDITAPTIDLVLISQNLAGTATTETSNTKLDVTLGSRVLFGKDSAKLLPKAQAELADLVAALKKRGPGSVKIIGYTDDLGSAEHGYVLSRQRANAVRRVIEPQLPGYDLSTLGKGEDDPLVPNTSEKNRQQNRRVEIHYTA